MLAVSADMSADVVYKLTKAIFQNLSTLGNRT
jgi:TRAP-type uncharacterized transport system substrate-binding protein